MITQRAYRTLYVVRQLLYMYVGQHFNSSHHILIYDAGLGTSYSSLTRT